MKAITLGQEINGIRKVEEIRYEVDENYVAPQPILTDAEVPIIEHKFGKTAYIGYDESINTFTVIYEARELTQEEKLQAMQTQLNLTQNAIDDIILGGM